MGYYYANAGFGHTDILPAPTGAVALADEEHAALFARQAEWKNIMPPDAGHDKPWLADPPPPTPDQLEAAFSAAVTARLNDFALERQYDDITSARLAALSGEFAADGTIAQAAYDNTWTSAIALMPQVRSGELMPEQALEQLPALAWPVS